MKCEFIGFNVINSKKGDTFFKLYFTQEISSKEKGIGSKCFEEFTSIDYCNYEDCLFPCDVDLTYSKSYDGKAVISDILVL